MYFLQFWGMKHFLGPVCDIWPNATLVNGNINVILLLPCYVITSTTVARLVNPVGQNKTFFSIFPIINIFSLKFPWFLAFVSTILSSNRQTGNVITLRACTPTCVFFAIWNSSTKSHFWGVKKLLYRAEFNWTLGIIIRQSRRENKVW